MTYVSSHSLLFKLFHHFVHKTNHSVIKTERHATTKAFNPSQLYSLDASAANSSEQQPGRAQKNDVGRLFSLEGGKEHFQRQQNISSRELRHRFSFLVSKLAHRSQTFEVVDCTRRSLSCASGLAVGCSDQEMEALYTTDLFLGEVSPAYFYTWK